MLFWRQLRRVHAELWKRGHYIGFQALTMRALEEIFRLGGQQFERECLARLDLMLAELSAKSVESADI